MSSQVEDVEIYGSEREIDDGKEGLERIFGFKLIKKEK